MQIPLELKLPVKAELDDFIASNQREIINAITKLLDDDGHQFVYIWGGRTTGKTHLLSAVCQLAEKQHLQAIYLPLNQFAQLSPEICDGLEAAEVICIDNIDQIAGRTDWEQAIFHLYNRARDAGRKLLVSGNQNPLELPITLADLKSRLAWGITLALQPLTDEQKKMLLQQRANQLGMQLPDETVSYLLTHHSRTLSDLLDTLDKLERASLAAQRKLTVPFVKEFLLSA